MVLLGCCYIQDYALNSILKSFGRFSRRKIGGSHAVSLVFWGISLVVSTLVVPIYIHTKIQISLSPRSLTNSWYLLINFGDNGDSFWCETLSVEFAFSWCPEMLDTFHCRPFVLWEVSVHFSCLFLDCLCFRRVQFLVIKL